MKRKKSEFNLRHWQLFGPNESESEDQLIILIAYLRKFPYFSWVALLSYVKIIYWTVFDLRSISEYFGNIYILSLQYLCHFESALYLKWREKTALLNCAIGNCMGPNESESVHQLITVVVNLRKFPYFRGKVFVSWEF